jgi:type IV pilus assembly protein PilA
MLKVHRNSKGFTLIELLIVIAIIGILAAIAIPAYTGYTRKARVQEIIHSMGAVKTAIMAYYTESSTAPLAADANAIKTDLGIDVPTKYLTSMVVTRAAAQGPSTITATLNNVIGGDTVNTTVILDSSVDYKQWTWNAASTLPLAYLPKN